MKFNKTKRQSLKNSHGKIKNKKILRNKLLTRMEFIFYYF